MKKRGRFGNRIIVILVCMAMMAGCKNGEQTESAEQPKQVEQTEQAKTSEQPEQTEPSERTEQEAEKSIICAEGADLESRFRTPDGYVRTDVEEGSLGAYLRKYSLKEDGAPVLLYDGREKGNQSAHAAVFSLPIEEADLQQCADSIMRVYAEYYWNSGRYEKIAFHFTNGFFCEYEKWREGYRIKVDGNDVWWSKEASYDDSYETFVKYLQKVFTYAGTLSLESIETETISLSELEIGDVIIKGGSPGHVIMVVDVCENEEGEKAWLFGQGYMPAQEFHVIQNPLHENDPWYYGNEIEFPLQTAEYVFTDETMVRRLK